MITAALQGYDRPTPLPLSPKQIKIICARPDDDAAVRLVARCMVDTGTCRSALGIVLGSIPWNIVMDWCDRKGVDRDLANFVWDTIHIRECERIAEAIASIDDHTVH